MDLMVSDLGLRTYAICQINYLAIHNTLLTLSIYFLRFGLCLNLNILLRLKNTILCSIFFKKMQETKTMRELFRYFEDIVEIVNCLKNHLSAGTSVILATQEVEMEAHEFEASLS